MVRVKEIRRPKEVLHSWRDLCNEMFSDDQEERKEALRRYQRSKHLLMPSTRNMDEVDAPFHDFAQAGGVWTDQGPVQEEEEVKLNTGVLHDIGQHVQMTLTQTTFFHIVFNKMNARSKGR